MAIESLDRLLTVAEVADLLHVHPITVRRQIKAGKLPFIRIGRNVRVRRDDVEALQRPTRVAEGKLHYRWPPTPAEIERRKKAAEEMRRLRESSPPLGITTTELVRLARSGDPWGGLQPGLQWPPTPEELRRREEVIDEILARREKRGPIGIGTRKLVKEARRDLERRAERGRRRRR